MHTAGPLVRTPTPTLGGHVLQQAVQRAGLDKDAVEDVIMGCAMPQGTSGFNVGRQCALRAGLPEADEAARRGLLPFR
jgi:acetyl-CoA C-acetyltransferase